MWTPLKRYTFKEAGKLEVLGLDNNLSTSSLLIFCSNNSMRRRSNSRIVAFSSSCLFRVDTYLHKFETSSLARSLLCAAVSLLRALKTNHQHILILMGDDNYRRFSTSQFGACLFFIIFFDAVFAVCGSGIGAEMCIGNPPILMDGGHMSIPE